MKSTKFPMEAGLVAGIVAAAFVIRWHYTSFHPVMVPDYDGAEYIRQAENFLAGRRFYTVFMPPGMPLLISAALKFFREPQTAGMFVSALFGSGLCAAVYLFTKELFDRKAATVAAGLIATFPQLVIISTWVMSESAFACLLFMGLYAGLVFRRRRGPVFALLYGAVFGAAYLVRPEALFFFVGSSLIILAWELRAGCADRKRLFALMALAWLVCAAMCLPYMVYLKREFGHWTISGKVQYNLYQGVSYKTGTLRFIAENPGILLGKYLDQAHIIADLAKEFYPAAILALAAAGCLLSYFIGRHKGAGLLYMLTIPAYVCLLPFYFVDSRILGPYYSIPLIWAAVGTTFIEDRLLGRPRFRPAYRFHPLSALFVAALAAYSISWMGEYYDSPEMKSQEQYIEQRYLVSAMWLKSHSLPGDKVLSRELLLVFYTGREYINLPDYPPNCVWLLAREKGARYVIVDDTCINKRPSLGPLLAPLLGTTLEYPGFRLRYTDIRYGVLVYSVEDTI